MCRLHRVCLCYCCLRMSLLLYIMHNCTEKTIINLQPAFTFYRLLCCRNKKSQKMANAYNSATA